MMKLSLTFLIVIFTLSSVLGDKAPERQGRILRVLRRPRIGRQFAQQPVQVVGQPLRFLQFQSPFRQGRNQEFFDNSVQFVQVAPFEEDINSPATAQVVQQPQFFIAPQAQSPSIRNSYSAPGLSQVREEQPAANTYVVEEVVTELREDNSEPSKTYNIPEEPEVREIKDSYIVLEEEPAVVQDRENDQTSEYYQPLAAEQREVEPLNTYEEPNQEVITEVREIEQAPTAYYVTEEQAPVITDVRELPTVETSYLEPKETEPVGNQQRDNDEASVPESRQVQAPTTYYVTEETAPVVTETRENIQTTNNYKAPEVTSARQAQPAATYYVAEETAPVVTEARQVQTNKYSSGQSSTRSNRPEPIGLVRSSSNPPGTPGFERAFDYSFEAENGIKQQATGELRSIDDVEVMVMRGSYEYIGADGKTYVVDWYADETGFHPSAPHLPQSVEIPDEDHAELIEAQIRFAAEEKARAASEKVEVREEPDQQQYYKPSYSRFFY